tara:strand:- start:113204 stop:116155 length:2952 start_codon:yes stop_codon:yes gene_type:complete
MQQERTDNARPFHLSKPLRAITEAACSRPLLTLAVTALSAIAAVLTTVVFIEFRTQRSDLIDPTADFHRRWTSFTESFGDSSDLVVVVEGKNPDAIKALLEDLGGQLNAEPELFDQVLFKVETGSLKRKGLQYLSPAQLEQGLRHLEEFRPILNGGWNRLRLDLLATSMLIRIDGLIKKLAPVSDSAADDDVPLTPTEITNIEQKLADSVTQTERLASSIDFFVTQNKFISPWPQVVSVDPELQRESGDVVYLLSESGTIGFLKARPIQREGDFNGATRSIDRLRQLISDIRSRHPEVNVGLTGIPVLENDEMRRSQSDMIRASILSFVIVGIFLLVGFRGWKHPLLAMVMLAVGMSWTFGFTTVAIGHLNILSVSFAAILIGLGIDFAIHYLARYLELRHHGEGLGAALSDSSAGVGVGIVTAAVTTSLAFYCASFTEFLGVAELGLIAGSGVLICTAATFLVLPALVVVADRGLEHQALPTPFQGAAFRSMIHRFPGSVALLSLIAIFMVGSRGIVLRDGRLQSGVAYDYNLLNLQADGLESVEIQRRIFNASNASDRSGKGSLLFAVSVAKSASDARQLKARFEKLSSVDHVEELATRLPEFPPEQTELLIQGFNAQLSRLPLEMPPPPVINPNLVGRMLEQLLTRLNDLDHPQAESAAASIDRLLDALDLLELEDQLIVLSEYQQRLTASLLTQMTLLAGSADPEPVTVKDLPAPLASRFVSSDGRWLLQIYPKKPIWDIDPLRAFVNDVRTVDPEVTGTPLQNYEASQQIMQSYQHAAVYAIVVITIVLLINFLGPDGALRTLLPSIIITGCVAAAQYSRTGNVDWWILLGSFMSLMMSISAVLNFRSVVFTILALVPPLLGGLLSYGALSILGLSFNPANLILLPLILGIGVDDGVHVLHDFHSQHDGYRLSPSTMNAIVLTSLTSMIGFGSMMIAAHRGLYSVGLVLVIGVGSCLFVSLVTLPAILTVFRKLLPNR